MLLARDRLYHYNLHHPTDATASNILAVLYEMEAMYQSAVESYTTALKLLDPKSEVIASNYSKLPLYLSARDLCIPTSQRRFPGENPPLPKWF